MVAKQTETAFKPIHMAMAAVMADVGHISKDRKNVQQGYNFRGVDDVYQALQVIMAKHGVFSLPTILGERSEERTTKSGGSLIYRVLTIKYTFYAFDGSSVDCSVVGEGMDSGDKASNKAMSVADKYALLQAFKIPTAEAKDPENDDHDIDPKPGKQADKQEGSPPVARRPAARPAATTPLPKYDNTNVANQKLIAAKMRGHVDEMLWDEIGAALHGRSFEDLRDVANAAIERAESASGIPF